MIKKIKLGIPGGSLEKYIEKLFLDAGYDFKKNSNPLLIEIDDPEVECFFDRANEIARLVDEGILDAGISSKAAILEAKAKNAEICEIGTPGVEWDSTKVILAVPKNSKIRSVSDLQGKKIITRLPEITKDFLRKNKISAKVEITSSSAESKVEALADAVVEFTNTGSTLKFYNLIILDVLMNNANMLYVVASEKAIKDKWKKEKIENLGFLLKGARLGQEMAGLMLHASNNMMEEVLKVLPSLKKPTVTHLRGENWFDIFTVVSKKNTRKLIPKLKKIGCTDIVEFPLNKVIS